MLTLDGAIVSRATLPRAPLAILFVTTFDVPSQLAAKRLADVSVKMGCGALGIVLEPPENRILAEAFGRALHLPYPLAMADAEILRGGGPFGGVVGVPTLLILDRRGRIAYRSEGLPSSQQIANAFGFAARR
ncbi:MAG: hypothetical protein SFV15_01865 [Polyangiaceae bacterium]|nr:hypothetical protein [Polyangiaceae bacterium]